MLLALSFWFSLGHLKGASLSSVTASGIALGGTDPDLSVSIFERALTQRDGCGRRLKQMRLSGDATEEDDSLVLEPFRDLVDKIQWCPRG